MTTNPQGQQQQPEAAASTASAYKQARFPADGEGGAWDEIISSLHTACDAQNRISHNLLQENHELRRRLAAVPNSGRATLMTTATNTATSANEEELESLRSTIQDMDIQLRRLETERDEWVTKFRGMKARWEKASAETRDLRKKMGRSG